MLSLYQKQPIVVTTKGKEGGLSPCEAYQLLFVAETNQRMEDKFYFKKLLIN